MKLYDFLPSGNSYKVRLLFSWLGAEYETVSLDVVTGQTQTPEFLAVNPAGQIPVLELDDGRTLAESNAILFYLALGTKYLPPEAFTQADILRWMCFEQYKHETAIAVARYIRLFAPQRKKELPTLLKKGETALNVMEQHLGVHDYFVGDGLTIADISLYAYTHVAGDGGFDLKPFRAIKMWMQRVEAHSKHIKITAKNNG